MYPSIILSLIAFTLLSPPIHEKSLAQTSLTKDRVWRVVFRHGKSSAVRTLQPYSNHIYKFRARAAQQLIIKLRLHKEEFRPNPDLVFWVQTKGWYPPTRTTAFLDGIDKGGVTDWSGILPGTGEYEIYVSNPQISDHPVTSSLRYALEIQLMSRVGRAVKTNARLL